MTDLSADFIRDRIYAGFLGKAIGVRVGAPVEPTIWTYERIRDTYGEITGYLRDFKTFAADDDTNGPVYFIRALRDYGLQADAADMGRTWLNYAAEEHGMYWWGGYNVSTEHTAYANLKAGIAAPRSGSIAQNGHAVAEQIGGQIFIDSWGWVHPGRPEEAARRSAQAASVAHDGNGLEGARFVAACIAAAFVEPEIDAVMDRALATLDPASTYTTVTKAVRDFHSQHPGDWRACRAFLADQWGYDRYPGVCHIIPNAGVMVMALAYGAGDLCRTVEIATMAGWDTDCNAGNAGAIVGTMLGVSESWDKYRRPINDMIVASGIAGSLNVVDIPTFAAELTVLALDLVDSSNTANTANTAPELWRQDMSRKGVRFDFTLPGATHGFQVAGFNQAAVVPSEGGKDGAMAVLVDRFLRGETARVFWKPFYRKSDFDDERYRPMFSPLVADGQTVTMRIRLEPWEGDGNLRVVPYVRQTLTGKNVQIGGWQTPGADWQEISFVIPDGAGQMVDEIGLEIEYFGRLKFLGKLWLSEFTVTGPGTRQINPAQLVPEWNGLLGFSWNRGRWTLEEGEIQGHTGTDADAWTGNYYATDQRVTAQITPLSGDTHLVSVRVQGTSRFYAAGFHEGSFVLLREDFGTEILARADADPEVGTSYAITVEAIGDTLTARLDDGPGLSATDATFAYGMAGLRIGGPGRMRCSGIRIEELT